MSTDDDLGDPGARGEHVVRLAVGLCDLALESIENAVSGARGLLRRSDLKDIAADGLASLAARGDLARARAGTGQAPHVEFLAQRAAERTQAADA